MTPLLSFTLIPSAPGRVHARHAPGTRAGHSVIRTAEAHRLRRSGNGRGAFAAFESAASGRKLMPGKTRYDANAELLFVLLGLNHLLAAVEAGRADVVTASHFTSRRLDGESRVGKKVMRATIATAGSRFFILLNSHFKTPR